jgi:uncharacterized protein (DUF58 family)
VPGDDVRHLDWKAFARHRHLVLRQFEEERDSWVHVLLDVTGSMTRGHPPKIDVARTLAAAYAYVASRQFDRVRVVPFADTIDPRPLAIRGPRDLPTMERFLTAADAAGPTGFADAARDLSASGAPRGLVVVITDLMTPDGWEEGLRRLGAQGHEVRVVHLRCAEDLDPRFRGELELIDAETEERVRLRVGDGLRAAYKKEIARHLDACRHACRAVGGHFLSIDTSASMDAIVREAFHLPRPRVAAGGAR